MARGGRRQGTPGSTYSNRSDLAQNYAPSVPQRPTPTAGISAVSQSGPQPAQPTQTAAAPAGPPLPTPGSLNIFGPTNRPNEPLTHGLPTGPGAGPEALAPAFTPDPLVQASALLSALPAVHQTPAIRALSAAVSASVANGTQSSIAQGGQ
jgi:hypothetical protein